MAQPGNISNFDPQWLVHGCGLAACGHRARIDLGRFMAWGIHDVPMVALCRRLRCPECGGKGPAEIGTGWLGRDPERGAEDNGKVRELKPRNPK
jgi:hypothetical protein